MTEEQRLESLKWLSATRALTREESYWLIETIERQREEIRHLTVLRTTLDYEERRASERALLSIAQSKVLKRIAEQQNE